MVSQRKIDLTISRDLLLDGTFIRYQIALMTPRQKKRPETKQESPAQVQTISADLGSPTLQANKINQRHSQERQLKKLGTSRGYLDFRATTWPRKWCHLNKLCQKTYNRWASRSFRKCSPKWSRIWRRRTVRKPSPRCSALLLRNNYSRALQKSIVWRWVSSTTMIKAIACF